MEVVSIEPALHSSGGDVCRSASQITYNVIVQKMKIFSKDHVVCCKLSDNYLLSCWWHFSLMRECVHVLITDMVRYSEESMRRMP